MRRPTIDETVEAADTADVMAGPPQPPLSPEYRHALSIFAAHATDAGDTKAYLDTLSRIAGAVRRLRDRHVMPATQLALLCLGTRLERMHLGHVLTSRDQSRVISACVAVWGQMQERAGASSIPRDGMDVTVGDVA